MFTLPKLRHAQPWHEQLKVRQWVNQFFALGSRKRNYHVTIGNNPHGHLAWVHAEARRVYISSSLLPVPPDHVRFDPVDEHRRTELLLKALLAHEAGHVRFSGPNPGGKLGELWNSLEDERIERLMAREFHELGPAFTFIGDIAAETGRGAGAWSYTAMEGALIWRFEHDRFHAHWAPRAEDHDIWHRTVRPLVESAWTLGTSEGVLAVAGEILEVLRQHQRSLTPPPAPEPEEQTPPSEQDPAATEPEDGQKPEDEPETDSGEDQGQFQ
ncbi:hypothetical protein [Deinococcus marmoris]|uniref:Uncharacterized protein n=1 Tax=Deinococcus marmoris TaxID=249408 RepID=A0A1U7NTG5_9DEIO|nr:hypothetical protein [Deinococcus marmoris]OLV16218.1 hypothetical protein BOO71_0012502 [Deinococcus marmoris]